MKLYQRYIGYTLINTIFLVLLVLAGLELLIAFIGQLNDIGTGDFGLLQAVEYVFLDMPRHIYTLFPMSALVGVLMGLSLLAANSELIVMRSAGVSLLQIAGTVMIVALSVILIVSIMGETIGPRLKRIADDRKSTQLSGGQALKTRHGTWIRDGKSYVHIEAILPGEHLQGISRYEFNKDGQLISASYAKEGSYNEGRWILKNVEESQIEDTKVTAHHYDKLSLQMALSPRLLRISQIEPEDMSLSQLRSYITYQEENGLRASTYDLAFWQRVLQPLATCIMVLLAIPFIFGPLRSTVMGLRLALGIMVGFLFNLLNQFFGPISLVYQFPPFWAALFPTLLVGVAVCILLHRTR